MWFRKSCLFSSEGSTSKEEATRQSGGVSQNLHVMGFGAMQKNPDFTLWAMEP